VAAEDYIVSREGRKGRGGGREGRKESGGGGARVYLFYESLLSGGAGRRAEAEGASLFYYCT